MKHEIESIKNKEKPRNQIICTVKINKISKDFERLWK